MGSEAKEAADSGILPPAIMSALEAAAPTSESSRHGSSDKSAINASPPERWGRWKKKQHRCDQRIGFREFIEALVRLSAEKYRPVPDMDLSQKFEALIRDHVWPFAGGIAGNADIFLRDAFDVSKVAFRHAPTLTQLFNRYSEASDGGLELCRKKEASDPTLSVRQFLILLRDFGLLGKLELPVRRALDLFKEEDGGKESGSPKLALPPHHEPVLPAPEPDRPRQREAAGTGNFLGGPRGMRGNSFLSRNASNMGFNQSRRSLLSNTNRPRRPSAVGSRPNLSPSRQGSSISGISVQDQDSRSDISRVGGLSPISPAQPAIPGRMRSLSRCSHQSVVSTGSSAFPSRFSRQSWLKQNILGGKNCPELVADRQLVYIEFVDALAKVAKARVPASKDCASLASRFDKLLRERFASEPSDAPLTQS